MDTKPLEKFAQSARRQLHEQVRARLEQVLRTDSPELRAKAKVVADLNKQIAQSSRQEVVERVAYTWFNRFCALRYMDANHYTRLGVVSPAAGFTQPEILQEAKAGHIDPDLAPFVDSQRVFDLLSGRFPSPDPQQEAYRLLLVASCNQYHAPMPFLFEQIDDYTELLMPADLLSAGSVLTAAGGVLTAEVCQDVEVLGWLYQFYISEKKDEVIGGKKAITPENIPAATQLFTPHWIVRYLVENSLGRLWLLNRPTSRLAEKMEFYIPDDHSREGDNLLLPRRRESIDVDSRLRGSDKLSPEDLTVCDPAAGSGHMLTYAFDLLYAIYEEEGYDARDIPRLILQKNLAGLEIDERAGALAAFALTMKARAKDARFFRRGIAPAITVLHPIALTEAELEAEVAALAPLLTGNWEARPRQMTLLGGGQKQLALVESSGLQAVRDALRHDLNLFREADNFGSLLRPLLSAAHLTSLRDHLSTAAASGQLQLFDEARRKKALRAITQAIPLAHYYDVVIANPPYLGNFDDSLKKFAKDNYPDSKSDLFAMFMERNLDFALPRGFVAMINMHSWMFLSSYEKLREKLLSRYAIASMAHIGARGFDSIGGEVVSTTAFVLENAAKPESKGAYVRLVDGRSEAEKANALREAIQNPDCGFFYRAAATDFKKIPGSPIAYWLKIFDVFDAGTLSETFESGGRLKTHGSQEYIRYIWEVSHSSERWKRIVKGGEFRKWFGHEDFLADWSDMATAFYREKGGLPPQKFMDKEGVCWSKITSSYSSFRIKMPYTEYDSASPTIFPQKSKDTSLHLFLAYLNSPISRYLLGGINPTLNTQLSDVLALPSLKRIPNVENTLKQNTSLLVKRCKQDWDSFETSWDFSILPLLHTNQPQAALAATYATLRQQWQAVTLEMQRLEEENNRLFIAAYGLQDELTPDVPLSEITLTCNPHYRYGGQCAVNSEQFAVFSEQWAVVSDQWAPGEEGREQRLLADTLREFISYAVGCMFGRYSLDKPGLILANQGETLEDYVQRVQGRVSFRRVFEEESSLSATTKDSSPGTARNDMVDGITYLPDRDNAIPMLDGDWFNDDITERFKKFLRVTFGEAHYEDNLAFIETALGRDIRGYFLREFYDHHVKTYKKRPIYWLFSSAKGSFNVLIYMHRYKPDTVSVVLNDYLREFRAKLSARKSHLEGVSVSAAATPRDKTRALKEIADIGKTLKEIREYEDDVLYPLATRQVQIDLDDGVKVNYNKFGKALRKVTGLTE